MSIKSWFKKRFGSKSNANVKKNVFTKLPFESVHEALLSHSAKAAIDASNSFFGDLQHTHGWSKEEFAQAYELAVADAEKPRYLN